MGLFVTALEREVSKMHANNIRLKVVGDLSRFAPKLQDMIANAERKTANNTRLTVTVCANYGGRWDIMQATGKMVAANPGTTEFTEDMLAPHLAMAYAPEPDLFIRTGGEERISNFLLWQLAYSELYFTDAFWPDFSPESLDTAIASYQNRERRFGRTGEQVANKAKTS
jgi:undecaprenyl diphosphate synthase